MPFRGGCDLGSQAQIEPRNSKVYLEHGIEIPEIFATIVHRRAELVGKFWSPKSTDSFTKPILIRLIYPLVMFSFNPSVKKNICDEVVSRSSLRFSNYC